jgi:7-cyano-7-deazaguanine synthase
MKKALVVLSGGMDSATALAWTIHGCGAENVETVTFCYGSKHNSMENVAAKEIADHFKVNNILIELPFVNQLFKSDLLQSGGEIPEGHYADPSMKRTVVPFRNGIMLAVAAGLAESLEMDTLVLGNHAGDHAIYPDCREAFSKPMSDAIQAGTYAGIVVVRPFEKISKTDIARMGASFKVPYELTYSCYKGGEQHCGKCGTCYERKEAFKDSGVADPTQYEG